MRTDDPAAIVAHLGRIEDDMAQLELDYAAAAGEVAKYDKWYRTVFVAAKEEFKAQNLLTHEGLGLEKGEKATETAKKDFIDAQLRKQFATEFSEWQDAARRYAQLKVRFDSMDTRRSIGQTALKIHLQNDPQYGQAARGQAGLGD